MKFIKEFVKEFARRFRQNVTGEWKATLVATLATLVLAIATKIVPAGWAHEFLYDGEIAALVGLALYVAGKVMSVHSAPDDDNFVILIGLAGLCWMVTATAAGIIVIVLLAAVALSL